MAKKTQTRTAPRNTYVVAMNKRHPGGGRMRDRRERRAKDARKSWKRDHDCS
jgi:hypothetical protein